MRRLLEAALAFAFVTRAEAQPARPLFVTGSTDGVVLPDVRAAASSAAGVVVLSRPAPALHLRSTDGRIREWGASGAGPGELRDPVDVAWNDAGGLVLDAGNHRLTGFSNSGALTGTRPLGGDWANRVALVARDTLIQVFVPMDRQRAVVRIAGARVDTVLRYERTTDQVHLAPPSGPSYTVNRPYVADAQWAPLGDVGVAFWPAAAASISIRDRSGRETARYTVPTDRHPIQEADREVWFSREIPQDFMGRRIFEGVRALARSTIRFPSTFPAVTRLMGDPDGGLWICRTASGSGELWQELAPDGRVRRSLRLPAGRELLSFGRGIALARARTVDDEPVVEAYGVPR